MRIEILAYSPHWPRMFEDEAALLAPQLPGSAVIEHIGSTAVPGLAAKPVIDILVGLADFAQANSFVPRIEQLGYEYVPEYETEMPFRRFFRKDQAAVRTHHIHMVAIGTDFWQRHLLFRDHLRANPEIAAEYAALKRTLATRDWQDMNEYADAKTEFIRHVEADAANWAGNRISQRSIGLVDEMPDKNLLTIQPLDPEEDDGLIDELLQSNPRFQALVSKSKAGSRKPFLAE